MIIKSQILFLKSILYLAAVVEAGSVTKAAERNGIKQANLSRIIKDLEKVVGTQLFIRKSSGLVPTQAAMMLYEQALELQRNLQMVQSLKTTSKSGNLCVLLYKPGTLILDFLKEFSAVRIEYIEKQENFDVGLFYECPNTLNCDEYQIGEYELHIGDLTQQLWIACRTSNPAACILTDFITSRLFS